MRTKHTPGPWPIDWYVCREGKEELWRVPRSIGPVSVDHDHWAGNHLTLDAADAALVAAAPDLLVALQALEALFYPYATDSTQRDWIDRARATIAKATGAPRTPQPADAEGAGPTT